MEYIGDRNWEDTERKGRGVWWERRREDEELLLTCLLQLLCHHFLSDSGCDNIEQKLLAESTTGDKLITKSTLDD